MTDNARWLRAMPFVFVVIWSTGFIVARYGMPYAPPMHFLAVRYALTVVCFAIWVTLAAVAWPTDRAQWGHLLVTGVLMQAGYLGGVWSAVHAGMGAGLVALLVGIQPVLTAVWLAARGGAVSGRQWSGLALGFSGLLLVLWRKLELGTGEVSATTLSLAVAALLSITVGTLYQKRFVAPCDVRSANLLQQVAALVVTLPFVWFEAGSADWNPTSVAAMAWSVLALSVGGSSLLYMLIQQGSPTAVTSLLYLVPPCTALMAWLLFDEPITLLTLCGIGLTAAGVWLVVREKARSAVARA